MIWTSADDKVKDDDNKIDPQGDEEWKRIDPRLMPMVAIQ